MAYSIKLKDQNSVQIELIADAAIIPGMLVEEMSTGKVRAHSTANGNCLPMFALENELEGKGIDTAYAQGDQVQVWIPSRGDEVYAYLASGQNISRGTFLTSNGSGYVQAFTVASMFDEDSPLRIVGVAIESVNASSAPARIRIRII